MAISNGLYEIRSLLLTSMCVDVAGASAVKGANVIIYSSNDGNNQKFYLTEETSAHWSIQSASSGLFVDVAQGAAQNGANVQQWTDNDQRNQRWRITDTGETVTINGVSCPVVTIGSYVTTDGSTYMMDVERAMTTNSTNILIWSANGGDNQKFVLLPTTLLDSSLIVPQILGWADNVGDDDYGYYHGAATTLYPAWRGSETWSSVTTNGFEGRWRQRTQDYDTGVWGDWGEFTAWTELTTYRDGTTFWMVAGLPATLPSDKKCRRYEFQIRAFAGTGASRVCGRATWTFLEVLSVPDVTLFGAGFGIYGLRVPYTSDYTGGTTNICLVSITVDGEEMLAEKYKWYTGLDVSGTLYVPIESLTGWIDEGATADVSYVVGNDQRLSFASLYTDSVTVSYNAGTITPLVTPASGRTLRVEVDADVVHVWWRYGGVMRESKVNNGVAYVTYPFGQFEVFVSAMNGDVSEDDWGLAHMTLTAGVGLLSGQPACHAWDWDGGNFLLEVSDGFMQTSRTMKADYSEYQLNEREWHSLKFSDTLGGTFDAEGVLKDGLTESDKASLMALMSAHNVIYRAPSGEVADVGITDVKYTTINGRTSVSVSMVQVS